MLKTTVKIDPEKHNETIFWKTLEQLDPFLYQLRVFLDEFHVHPEIIPKILRHLILVDKGTGYHTIEIIIRDHKVAIIKGADTDPVNLAIRLTTDEEKE